MKKFHLFLFILIVFFFQYSILGVFFQSGRVPNLFVALVTSLAIIFGFEKSLGWTLLTGFFLDIGSSWLVGSGTLALITVLWLIDKTKAIAEFRSRRYLFAFLLFLTAGISSVAFDVLAELIFKAEKIFSLSVSASSHFPVFDKDYILKTAYTACSVIAVHFFVRKIPQRASVFLAGKRK